VADHNLNAKQPHTANEIHQALLNVLLEGGGLSDLAATLSNRAGQPVLIADMAGVILAGRLPPAGQADFAQLARWAGRSERLDRETLQGQAHQLGLYLVPLIVQSQVEGLMVTEAFSATAPVKTILEQGATIATLALIKHQAVREVEQRQRRDLMEELLSNESWPGGRLAEQARLLGWDFEFKPVVILVDFGPARRYALGQRGAEQAKLRRSIDQFQQVIRQLLDKQYSNSIIAERHHGFIILPHLTGSLPQAREHTKALINLLRQQLQLEGVKINYTVAVGGLYPGIEGLPNSFQEAQWALDIGLRLEMRRPVWFDEVQLYLLLERANRREDIQDWLARTLGPLVEYDRRNKTQMLQTLELFFDSNQTLQEAAHSLHIHPNTLKYRLGRIEQILGQDPFKGENQLRFYLATKMAKLLG
jgi:purine catabolism regulator